MRSTTRSLLILAVATLGVAAAVAAASAAKSFAAPMTGLAGTSIAGPALAPTRSICRDGRGELFVRKGCKGQEDLLSPTALRVCRNGFGQATLRGADCRSTETRVDLRGIRGMSLQALLGVPPAATKTNGKNPAPTISGFLQARDGLCRDGGTGVTVRAQCTLSEIPLAPGDLRTCVTTRGTLELRASHCGAKNEDLDLRDLLGVVRRVGIGELVGILPRVGDLAEEVGL